MPGRTSIAIATLLCLTAGVASSGTAKTGTDEMIETMTNDHDFVFLVGKWTVKHRQLKERLAGNTEWIEFTGTSELGLIMGGNGTFDHNRIDKPDGSYYGVTLRTYDQKTKEWRIYWFDSRYPGAPVEPALVGKFHDGKGVFYSDETFNGRPINVRFIWSQTKTGSPRWEQAFSPDGGQTWETNWIMDFTRATG
jgi:hypothetical protein